MSPPVTRHLDTELAMSQIGDAETMNGMLTMLEESLSRDVPHIAQLLAQGEVKLANRMLHSLKGFVPIFCGEALCTRVASVELLSKTGQADEVAIAYAALQPELEGLLGEVESYLQFGPDSL